MSAERVVITGAASGIGAATMTELERRGARVVGLDRNVEDQVGGDAGRDVGGDTGQRGLIQCDEAGEEEVVGVGGAAWSGVAFGAWRGGR